MESVVRSFVALAVLAVSAIAVTSAGAVHLTAEVYGLTGENRLVSFSAASPEDLETNVEVSGLQSGESLIGIDFRPVDGKLWAVGKLGTAGRMYTIDPESGEATFVATLVNAAGGAPIALMGSSFGFDFNPVADALRIVSDTGQNLRALPSDRVIATVQRRTGDTFVDGTLNYVAGTTATGIGGAAYTNNDADPATTTTTLYDIDANLDDLVVQNPPNNGTLVKVADLGTPTEPLVGFDIRTLGTTDIAYIATTEQRGNGATLATLHTIDLTTGATGTLGKIGGPKTIRGIAVAP